MYCFAYTLINGYELICIQLKSTTLLNTLYVAFYIHMELYLHNHNQEKTYDQLIIKIT